MSITVPRWRFTQAMIDDAPEWKGVYVLWSHAMPLAVGHARGRDDTIRSRLLAHWSRAAEPAMDEITHYSWEICRDPLNRAAALAESLGPAQPEWTARESS